ncbi:MAG: rhomboid family intramembrane serine protease [Deltaproteobacteria bacterium]|nr:rhomboid family intramembrane serine protease [Deltaproteobacteria bacterium]
MQFEKPPKLTALWMGLLFGVTSLIALLAPSDLSRTLFENIAFTPTGVTEHFRLWTLITFPVADHEAISGREWFGLLFHLLFIYWFAAPLEHRWGPRRFVVFLLLTSTAASLALLAFSGISSMFSGVFPGPGSVVTAFIFAWAFTFRDRTMNFLIIGQIRGLQMAWLGVFYILMDAIFKGPAIIVPRTAAALMAIVIVMGLWRKNALKLGWDWVLVKLRVRKPPKLTLVPPPRSPGSPKKPHKFDIN